MPDDATLQTQLEEARAALHRLMIGEAEVTVEHEGYRVQFNRASAGELRRHIRALERALGHVVPPAGRAVSFR